MFESIEALRASLGEKVHTREYQEKMLHPLPAGVVEVDRRAFIVQHCQQKRVLEFGATGVLSEEIQRVATAYLGVDQAAGPHVVAFDLDDVSQQHLPTMDAPEILILGEVLEHLSNPGWFLTRLKRQYDGVPVIITVPNAYWEEHLPWLRKGLENVNGDHVAWYSPKVLACLLIRAGYDAGGLFWYHGSSATTAEGLVVVTQ